MKVKKYTSNGTRATDEISAARAQRPGFARRIVMALLFLAIVVAVALLGSLATIPNTEDGWYPDVDKVAWNPPNWLFGPAWSLLYLMIAVCGFLIWRAGHVSPEEPNRARTALVVYAVQMVLNLAWTPVFFAGYPLLGPPAWWTALVIIIALIGSVIVLMRVSWRWSRTASLMLVPYLLWLVFAASLNAGIIALN